MTSGFASPRAPSGTLRYLPDVVIGQERLQRSVAGEVAVGPLGDQRGVGHVQGTKAATVVGAPAGHLLLYEVPEAGRARLAGHVEGDGLGPLLHGALDLDEGGDPRRARARHVRGRGPAGWAAPPAAPAPPVLVPSPVVMASARPGSLTVKFSQTPPMSCLSRRVVQASSRVVSCYLV